MPQYREIAHLIFQEALYSTVSVYFFWIPRMLFMPVIGQLVRRGENFGTILAREISLGVHREVMRPHIHFHLIAFWTSAFLNFQNQKIGVLVNKTLVVVLHNERIAFDWSLDLRSSGAPSICFGPI